MFEEDLDAFFQDWGVPATPQSGAAFLVIFDRAHVAAIAGHIDSTQPMCVAQTAHTTGLDDGSSLVIASQAYTVKDIEPDGTGISLITLHEA